MVASAWNTTRPDGTPPPVAKVDKHGRPTLSLIRQAQWAATVLRSSPIDLSAASADQLETLVRHAEKVGGTNRARRVDIFPRLDASGAHDTLIATTLRWLLYIGGTVTRRLFMTEYHARSTRTKRQSRSSFVNNVGPYCRGAGNVLELVDPDGKRLTVYGSYSTPGRHPALAPHPNHRTGVFVRWCGPSIEAWLAAMIPDDLDRAMQALERQLLDGIRPDETAWWLANVRGEIARRATGEPFVVTPSGVAPPQPTKRSRQQCRTCDRQTTRPRGICKRCEVSP